MKLLKKQSEYLNSIPKMDNNTFFNEFIEGMQPDDYDACWTEYGWLIRNAVYEEMIKRMKGINFLTDNYIEL